MKNGAKMWGKLGRDGLGTFASTPKFTVEFFLPRRDLRVNNNNYFFPVTDLHQTWLLHIFTNRLFSMFRSCVGLMAAPPENEKFYCPLCLLKKDKTKKGKSKKKKKS